MLSKKTFFVHLNKYNLFLRQPHNIAATYCFLLKLGSVHLHTIVILLCHPSHPEDKVSASRVSNFKVQMRFGVSIKGTPHKYQNYYLLLKVKLKQTRAVYPSMHSYISTSTRILNQQYKQSNMGAVLYVYHKDQNGKAKLIKFKRHAPK
jgi:hypothetical protein